ncbi:MAG TPA: DUF2937 family protein [Ramlibacter sp.]|jgi:hypothetical protein|uniref:DUF2937 family protein n=1 Tax=Ramlibacter sp. TaxID=1917967 RepID=UPI002D5C9124|nr:DUF2937 family protein [Ramlibacter sp.]HZY18288.1 DUF2937 family protein [Ramlibacter sp.]
MGIVTGLVDRVVLVAAFVGGATVPSFVAQYRQRVGGALEQARKDLQPFRELADRMFNGDLRALIDHHWRSTDPVFRGESQAISQLVESVDRLTRASDALRGDLYHQLLYLVTAGDPRMLRATWDQFAPAVSFTPQSLLAGAAIGSLVWLVFVALMHLVLALTQRRLPPLKFSPSPPARAATPDRAYGRASRPARGIR